MFCRVDNFDSTEFLAIIGLIQIRRCALNCFIVELVHGRKLDICHLHGLGAIYDP